MDEAASPPLGTPGGSGASRQERVGVDTEHLRDYRALRRDRQDRKVAGVCGGLARHLDVDPTLVRVVVVVLALFGGAGLLLYAALWVFVPDEGTGSALVDVGESTRNLIVVLALVIALLIALPSGLDGDLGAFVGLLLLGTVVGVVLLTRDKVRSRGSAVVDPGAQVSPGAPGAPGAPPAYVPATPRRRGPLLLGLVLASVALALGVLGTVETSGTSVPDAAYPALALAVTGGWLVVGSVWGRPGGVVLVGLVALASLVVTSVVEPRFEGERELVARPASADDLALRYDLPAGSAEIDLRGIRDLESLDGRTLDVELNAGEILLVVPDGLAVDLDAHVGGGGEISTPDVTRDGWGVRVDQLVGADDSRATLTAELDVAFGRIQVRSE